MTENNHLEIDVENLEKLTCLSVSLSLSSGKWKRISVDLHSLTLYT